MDEDLEDDERRGCPGAGAAAAVPLPLPRAAAARRPGVAAAAPGRRLRRRRHDAEPDGDRRPHRAAVGRDRRAAAAAVRAGRGRGDAARRAAARAAARAPPPAAAVAAATAGRREAEPAEDAPGGYHPVALGDVYDERYEVNTSWAGASTARSGAARPAPPAARRAQDPEAARVHGRASTNAPGPVRGEGRRSKVRPITTAHRYTASAVTEIEILTHIDSARGRGARHTSSSCSSTSTSRGRTGTTCGMVFELLGRTLLHRSRTAARSRCPRRSGARRASSSAWPSCTTGSACCTQTQARERLLAGPAPVGASSGTWARRSASGGRARATSRRASTGAPRASQGSGPRAGGGRLERGLPRFELARAGGGFDPQSPRPASPSARTSRTWRGSGLLGPVPAGWRRRRAARWFRGDGWRSGTSRSRRRRRASAIARVLERAARRRGARDAADSLWR